MCFVFPPLQSAAQRNEAYRRQACGEATADTTQLRVTIQTIKFTVAIINTWRATGKKKKKKIQSVCQCGCSCEDVDRLRLILVLRSHFNSVFYSSSTSRSPSPTVSPGLQWTFLTWTHASNASNCGPLIARWDVCILLSSKRWHFILALRLYPHALWGLNSVPFLSWVKTWTLKSLSWTARSEVPLSITHLTLACLTAVKLFCIFMASITQISWPSATLTHPHKYQDYIIIIFVALGRE